MSEIWTIKIVDLNEIEGGDNWSDEKYYEIYRADELICALHEKYKAIATEIVNSCNHYNEMLGLLEESKYALIYEPKTDYCNLTKRIEKFLSKIKGGE